MKNLTISLDDETANLARVQAARENKSVSRWVGGLLREHLSELSEYDAAMQRYFSLPVIKSRAGTKYPKREELYDRSRVR